MKKKSLNYFEEFFLGCASPVKGMRLLMGDRSLRRLSFWPFIIYILFFIIGLSFSSPLLLVVSSWVTAMLGSTIASGFLGLLILIVTKIMSWLFFVLVLGYGVFLVTNIIASPFYALLAEKILKDRGEMPEGAKSLKSWLGRNLGLILQALIKVMIFLILGAILFALSLIPAIGFIATFGFFLIIAFDCSDYSYEAVLWNFRQRMSFFTLHWAAHCGLALTIGFIFMIPIMNIFLFPMAVVGATDLFIRLRATDKASVIET